MLKELIQEGVNLFRINFSHGTLQENINAIKNIRKVDAKLGVNTGIIADLQGPKIRIGKMPKEGSLLLSGPALSPTTLARFFGGA